MITSIPTPADLFFREIRPATERMLKDGLTGYWWGIQYRGEVAQHARCHCQKNNIEGFCLGFDIRNVGGANARLNWSGVAKWIFEPYSRFLKLSLENTLRGRAQFLLFRQGGDEFSAIVAGLPGSDFKEHHLKAALAKFEKMVMRHNHRHKFDAIPNPKNPDNPGVGVICAYERLSPAAFDKVDRQIEKRKKEYRPNNHAFQRTPRPRR